jgi:crossover junction endodeoxyribonuclease RusA
VGDQHTYLLSWPPSTNDLWRAYKGRNILSRRARSWAEEAGKELLAQGIRSFKGPVHVGIELRSPYKRPFDPDNRVKALLDLLVKCAILEGDGNSNIHELHVYTQRDGFEGARVTITQA